MFPSGHRAVSSNDDDDDDDDDDTDLAFLDKVGDHHYTSAVLLPDHAPHVLNCPLVTACSQSPTAANSPPPRPYQQTSSSIYHHADPAPTTACTCWRRGVVVSGIHHMNEVNARRARLVRGWVTIFGWVYRPPWYVTSQLGQLSLASLRGRLIEYQLRLG